MQGAKLVAPPMTALACTQSTSNGLHVFQIITLRAAVKTYHLLRLVCLGVVRPVVQFYGKQGLLTVKEDKNSGDVILTSIKRNSRLYTDYR